MKKKKLNMPQWPFEVKRAIFLNTFLKRARLTKGGNTIRSMRRLRGSVPLDEKTIIFDTYFGKTASCNPFAVFTEMTSRFEIGAFRYVWIRRDGETMPETVADHPDVVFVERDSLTCFLELSRAKYIVFNVTLPWNFTPRSEQVLVSTWHGIPLKKMGFNSGQKLKSLINTQRCFNLSDIHLSSGEFYDEAIFESIMAPVNRETIHHIGFPRIDVLARHASVDELPKDVKPTLLYAPTWRGQVNRIDNEIEEQIAVCRLLSQELGSRYEIFAKPHHLVTNKVDLAALGVNPVPEDADINNFLTNVDVLVSDYSSIVIDFLALDRPVILYAYDLDEYRSNRGFSLDFEALPFQVVRKKSELLAALNAPRKPSTFPNFVEQRKKFLGDFGTDTSSKTVDLMLNYVRKVSNPDKRRILIYPGSFKPNGITSSFLNLTENLSYDDMDLYVVAHRNHIDANDDYYEQFTRLDPRTRILLYQTPRFARAERHSLRKKSPPRGFARRNQMFKRIANGFSDVHEQMWRDLSFDAAVDFSGYSPWGTMLMLTAKAKRKSIFLHNDMAAEIETRNNLSWVIPESYQYFDCIASVSPTVMARNIESFRQYVPAHLHKTCHNTLGARYGGEAPSLPCEWASHMRGVRKANSDAKIFVNVARISPEKNHKRLLDAFKILKLKNPNSFLYILGDGPDYDKTREYAAELDLNESVFFTGWISDPLEALKEADTFVLSSNYEGQPMVLLEAMALGKTCVAAENDATRYVLGNGKGIVTEANPKSLAEGMGESVSGTFLPSRFKADGYNAKCVSEFWDVVLGE